MLVLAVSNSDEEMNADELAEAFTRLIRWYFMEALFVICILTCLMTLAEVLAFPSQQVLLLSKHVSSC